MGVRFFAVVLVGFFVLGGDRVQAGLESGTVLITGANRGIGLEMARQFSARGFTVIGTARKPAEATDLKALDVQVLQLDVTDADSLQAMATTLEGVPIDLLINNAGIGGHRADSFQSTRFEEISVTFEVNSLGPMRVTQALLSNLQAGEGKTIVSVSSVMGSIERNEGGSYGYRASKAALNMFNKSLSAELGPQGFTAIVIHPGWVKTDMGGAAAPLEPRDSVAGIIAVVEKLRASDNGRFLDYKGEELPW